MLQTVCLLLLLALTLADVELSAAVRTVCHSGCEFTPANSGGKPVQAAINAANPGDIIEIAAGQTFTENIFLPYKNGSEYITIRSSLWEQLPPRGRRVTPAEAWLMPTIQTSVAGEVVFAGAYRRDIVQLDLSSDVVTFNSAALPNGTAVSCLSTQHQLPAGLERYKKYYIVDSSGATARLSERPNGPAVDLQSTGAGTIACTAWESGHHYRFIGIRFAVAPGSSTGTYALVTIGTGDEASTASMPHHVEFDRVIVTGNPGENGPRTGMILNGAHLSVTDSWIGHIKSFGEESKAIVMYSTPGPVMIRNNYLSAASIGILTGGSGNATETVASRISILGNHIQKVGYMFYKAGSGPPTGACYYRGGSGSFYRDTTRSPNTCANAACYECQPDGSWALSPGAWYRNQHFLTKSGIEFKQCDQCLVEGNVIEGTFAGPDGGNTQCINVSLLVQGGAFHYTSGIKIRNNWCKDTWSGIALISTAETELRRPSTANEVVNNLVTGLANFPAQSIYEQASEAQVRPLAISNGQEGVVVDHNTFRYAPGMAYQAQYGLLLQNGPPQFGKLKNIKITNNIFPAGLYTWFLDTQGVGSGCAALANFIPLESQHAVDTNVFYDGANVGSAFANCPQVRKMYEVTASVVNFVSDTDHRLSPESPFSASCSSNCLSAGTDGKDVGVDLAALNAAISGALSGQQNWQNEARLQIQTGSRHAVLSFHSSSDACTVSTYSDAARTTLIEDSNTAARRQDNRPSSVLDGRRRQFVIGAEAPLTPNTVYYGKIQCSDGMILPFWIRTQPLGVGARPLDFRLSDSEAVDAVVLYSQNDPTLSSASQSPPVSFFNQRAHLKLLVPATSILYSRWRKRDGSGSTRSEGPVQVHVTP